MCNSREGMKQNKNRILNLRITESEFEAVHRLSKHYKRPIADLLRSYINKEDLKLLHNEQSQETVKKPVVTLNKSVAMVSKGSKSNKVAGLKAEIKRKKGIKQNE